MSKSALKVWLYTAEFAHVLQVIVKRDVSLNLSIRGFLAAHSPSLAVVERLASSVSCQYSVASFSADRGKMVNGLLAESPKVTLASGSGIAGVSAISTFPEISKSVCLVSGDSGVAINCSSLVLI
jgi:hypothetical protein